MACGKILTTWSIGGMYWIKIIFSIAFYILGIILIVASHFSIFGFLVGFLLIILGIIYGSFLPRRGTPGKDTIYAKLFENCYLGYSAPLGLPDVSIDFSKNPKLLVIRYAYYFSPGLFRALDLPWQGWNILFIEGKGIAWGPNFSIVNYIRRDHVFMGSVIKRFRELNLEVEYVTLDPQYMDIFVEEMKRVAPSQMSLKEMIREIGLLEDGTFASKRPEKIYEPPQNLQRANVDQRYEDLLPGILSKY
jgi:hypothetical protein